VRTFRLHSASLAKIKKLRMKSKSNSLQKQWTDKTPVCETAILKKIASMPVMFIFLKTRINVIACRAVKSDALAADKIVSHI